MYKDVWSAWHKIFTQYKYKKTCGTNKDMRCTWEMIFATVTPLPILKNVDR